MVLRRSPVWLALGVLLGLHGAEAGTLLLDGRPPVDAETLLGRPDAAEIEVPEDPGYGAGPRRFRAVPLAPLARELGVTATTSLVARAADGFVTHIPGALALRTAPDGPRAWLAIESPDAPWPKRPGRPASAGPFYILWQPTGPGVPITYWPYEVTGLGNGETPAARWPRLNVAASLPAEAPERRGQAVFIAICLPCHRLGGAGEAEVGPDLNAPTNPTRYLQRPALLRLIRNAASLRTWPEQRMPPFSPEVLPDADIEAVVRFLEHVADR